MKRILGIIFLLQICSLAIAKESSPISSHICLSFDEGLDQVCARDISKDILCKSPQKYAWNRDSCLKINSDDLIREVVELNDDQRIPDQILKNSSSDKLARSLVYRYFQRYERPNIKEQDVASPSYNIYENAYPLMAVDFQNIGKIIKSGFLNQYQVGTSNGLLDPARRIKAENGFSGVNLGMNYELRPKYAYGAFAMQQSTLTPNFKSSYGDVLFAFKKDIKKRALISVGDSLNMLRSTISKGKDITTYYGSYRQWNFTKRSDDSVYYESQIFGKLLISDVAYILVGCPIDRKSATAEQVISVLKENNVQVPVYSCQSVTANDFNMLIPNKLLYGKDSSKEELPETNLKLIRVVEASFGWNLSEKFRGNVTEKASAFCDGKTSCTYKVSAKFIGDPASGQDKSFDIIWTCEKEGKAAFRTHHEDANADGKVFNLTCE